MVVIKWKQHDSVHRISSFAPRRRTVISLGRHSSHTLKLLSTIGNFQTCTPCSQRFLHASFSFGMHAWRMFRTIDTLQVLASRCSYAYLFFPHLRPRFSTLFTVSSFRLPTANPQPIPTYQRPEKESEERKESPGLGFLAAPSPLSLIVASSPYLLI